ncbi:DUF3035 domain-containing protein [Candidatus Phaeomarinobacter ectocarpi]|nr:DUF3035 domain-containing protein [Candidatus Phaeomarinobacter ectocarpi]
MFERPKSHLPKSRLPKSRLFGFVAALSASAFLAGCGGGLDDALGLGKNPPDEFAIVTKAPLAIPPDYSLRPPVPGAPNRQARSAQEIAAAALYSGRATGVSAQALGQPGSSAGESALIASAGAENASPEVRRLIENEYQSRIDADRSFADRIIFWQDRTPKPIPVDAQAEAQRLRKNDALGQPVTEGETPRIEPKENQGLLEGIF